MREDRFILFYNSNLIGDIIIVETTIIAMYS